MRSKGDRMIPVKTCEATEMSSGGLYTENGDPRGGKDGETIVSKAERTTGCNESDIMSDIVVVNSPTRGHQIGVHLWIIAMLTFP